MTSEAKRRANNKFDLKTYTVLGCKIRKEEAEAFKKACQELKTTPNEVFKKAISTFMATYEKLEGPAADLEDQEPEN